MQSNLLSKSSKRLTFKTGNRSFEGHIILCWDPLQWHCDIVTFTIEPKETTVIPVWDKPCACLPSTIWLTTLSVPVHFLWCVPDKKRLKELHFLYFCCNVSPNLLCVTLSFFNTRGDGWLTGCFKTSMPAEHQLDSGHKNLFYSHFLQLGRRWWVFWTALCSSIWQQLGYHVFW